MKLEMSARDLNAYVDRQLNNFFGPCGDVSFAMEEALLRAENCFAVSKNKYYKDADGNGTFFSPFHSGQYAIFLYFLANTAYRMAGDTFLAAKLYYLNKIMHSVDWYFEIELPEYWGVEHPLGSVMGRAAYGNGFYFYQGCTVGGNKSKYPRLGRNVIMYANATILGDTQIGDNVVVSTGAAIKDETIPGSCIVFGQSPNLIVKPKDGAYMEGLIGRFWSAGI